METENRGYQERWEADYLVVNNLGKLQCLVCLQIISVFKEYNVKQHYQTLHEVKYKRYTGESRKALILGLKKKIKQQTTLIPKLGTVQSSALRASYSVSLQLAKSQRPFTDGEVVKSCAIEMAKAFNNVKLAENFDTVPLPRATVQRRIVDMGEQVEKSIYKQIKSSEFFSICLDESTDQADISQLLIFARTVQDDFGTNEELLDVHAMHGTTKGRDVHKATTASFEKAGGPEKCSVIVTDGAPAMLGKKTGLVGLLKADGVECPTLHCVIHQEALCGKSIKQE